MSKRMISTDVTEEDYRTEPGLRPQKLSDYIGQEKAKNTLKIFIEAARQQAGLSGSCTAVRPARTG